MNHLLLANALYGRVGSQYFGKNLTMKKNNTLLRRAIAIASVASLSTYAVAEQDLFDLSLEDLMSLSVVTAASGYEQNIDDAPASVSIIHRGEWEATGATELSEVLNTVLGIHITTDLSALNTQKAVMRGLSGAFGRQVKVLINGKSFENKQDGGSIWGSRFS
ncbi:MAG: hypothetical protein COA42_08860, partial [Alteromonadaceae bacterium]